MKKVITTMLVAAMVLSMAVPTSAATITRKKSTGTSASTTKVSGDYSLKMVDKTLQFIRGGKVVSSIETKDGKITLRKSSAGGISVVFTDANGKRRNITLGKQDSVSLSGTFTQVSVDKALGSSFEVEMEKGSKVTNFYAKGAAKVTLNGSVTTLNVTSSNANVAANGTVSRAYAVNKKAITGMSSGKITQTSTGTSASGSVNTSTGSSSSSNTTVNSGSGSSGSSSSGSGIIINGGGSNNGGNTTSKKNPTVSYKTSVLPTYDEGTVLTNAMLEQFGLKATYGNTTVAGTFSWTTANTKVLKGTYSYSVTFTPKDTKTYNTVRTSVKIEGKAVQKAQTLAEAKAAIEAALKSSGFTNETTEAQIQKLADDCITSSDIQAVAKVTIVKATETAEGTIKGTIELTKGAEKETVTVDIKIAKLSALDAAKAEVETVLNGFTATKETDKAAIETALAEVIAKYKDVKISVGEVVLDETAKTVSVKVSLTEGDSEPVEVSKTWTYTEQASALEEAKAKVVAALDGITASKDIDKAAIEAALADIKAEYPTVEITVGDVVPNETAKTVSVEVSLKEGDKTDKVAKTWDYSGQAVAKKPTFTKHPEAPATGSDVTLSKDTPVTLEVAANVDGSTEGVTYQWYRSTSSLVDNATARTAIDGATSATYTLAPEDEGSFYFFAEATHTVGNTKESSFSNNVLLKVTVPAGSAVDKPTFKRDLTNGNRGVRLGEQTVLEVEVNTPSTANTTPKYQWYKSTDPKNPLNGQPMAGETNSTLTLANNTLGTASYYCVVTNVSTDDVDFNNRTATSKYETITVADTVGMRTVVAVTDATTGGTTKLNVTFTKEVTGLTAANFKVEGVENSASAGAATPTITVDRVESFSDNKSLYTLHVSGIDLDGQATVEFIAPDGFTVSGENPQTVNITAPTAPAEVLTVKEFTASKKNAQGETTQLKVTFDKKPTATAKTDYEVKMGPALADTLDISSAEVDPADENSVLLNVTLNDTPTDLKATLTRANGTALATADQKEVTVERDTTAPFVRSASLASLNTEIELLMSEPLKAGQTLTAGDFTIVDDPSTSTTISSAKFKAGSNNTVIVLTASAPIDIRTMTLSYTKGSDFIIDTAASENALVNFSGKVIDGAVLPDTLEIQEVEVTSKTQAVVKMNAPIAVDPAAMGNLDNLFKATNKTDGSDLPITSVALAQVETKARLLSATPTKNGFTITFTNPLPEDAVVVLSINPAATDVAAKITIDGKPEVKLPPETKVETPEVKSISATVADVTVSGIKGVEITEGVDVTVTLADGAFVAIAKDADVASWFTNLPTNMTAVAKEAVAAGDDKIVITIAGTPSVTSDVAMEITIPNANITGLGADTDLVVAANANAKFNITDAVAIESVVLSATPDQELTVDDSVPTIAVTPDADKFTIGTVDYTVDGSPSSASAQLTGKGGKKVVATVTLTAKDGFTFTGLTNAEVTGITNGDVAVTGVPGATAVITVTYTVANEEITDAIDLTTASTLESVSFTADSPTNNLPTSVTLSPTVDGISSMAVTWENNKSGGGADVSGSAVTPKTGDTITATITVTPATGYTFTDGEYGGTITAPGAGTIATKTATGGTLTITVTYTV